ncbi:XK-related protein 6 [Caerostris darwini]|uniref:XK-related protein n=1 Tax=Caerostris darwini TaxID=1538125 RepID=A0AAV4PGN6_9ARAC|nr:XK-related protein 6 [Caerostris darwini]
MDLLLIILSIGSFLVDIVTDIIVIFQYYKNGHFVWLILTTSLVCLPSLIVQIFSIRWYIIDGTATTFVIFMHIIQLGLFYRFLQLLLEGFRVRKSKSSSDLEKFNHQQSDISMLRLFESFTESAPQLVLQLYIMISTDDWNPWTGISAIASVVSLSWGIAAYSKAMRNIRPEKKRLSWWGLIFQALWRIGMVSSRIVSMVLFAVVYGYWLILGIGLHWLCMIIWIFTQNTDFCTTWWEEKLYNCVVAFFFTEKSSHHLRDFMAALVPGGMIIGLGSMLLYYRFFHPSGPIMLFTIAKPDENDENTNGKFDAKPTCSTLKTCRKFAEITDDSTVDSTSAKTPISQYDIQENLNNSKLSLVSKDKTICSKDLHRSHSLNCSLTSFDNHISEYSWHRKSFANHYRNINYHFRQAAAFGSISPKTHCSCLILAQELPKLSEIQVNDKLSNSLPNLEFSFETEDTNSTHMSKGKSFLSHMESIISSSSMDSEIHKLPVIHNSHIIRINVEGNI